MKIVDAVKTNLSKYATFSGRAARPEYWWFMLAVFIGALVVSLIESALFGVPDEGEAASQPLSMVYSLAILIPVMASGWRRMHDTGRPGWYLLLPYVVNIVGFAMLFLGVAGFTQMENAGADPDALRGGAVLLGGAGILILSLVQLVLLVLLIWWLSRPGEDGPNPYGPPPVT
ncbi:DUF805 domain-containing protein [Cognatishimia sp. F0-27]|uniref:DUF805 domain-containing protein n=1 Tax=Cognatishimia sp. F0-27 TaxID=2816855 RepID=UPI001D0C90B0|nr:DUF805 domain-containing protein [Cognatishimia sp. F0-27]MCC1491541.1 DUF805 domain-containing protein [Cognatishimia sp. F0-27]